MPYKPISDYGIIGDMRSAALVGLDGSIDWCCFPRFDSPSIFAALLDDVKGGRFQISPAAACEAKQAYLPNTNILSTTFSTKEGEVTLIDFMPPSEADTSGTCPHEIHRLLRCHRGQMELDLLFQPRFNYGRDETLLEIVPQGTLARGPDAALALASAMPLRVENGAARARFTLTQGQEARFTLKYGDSQVHPQEHYDSQGKLARTQKFWEEITGRCDYQGRWREEVLRSFLALHLLIYSPSGAIVAAPTTSLPEEIGGERNWDYRYCWLRDAAFTLDTFFHLGHTAEAKGFMDWLGRFCQACGIVAQTVYGVEFETDLIEETLNHLEGYRKSRPVRIGNGAARQFQLDIFGEVLLAFSTFQRVGGTITLEMWATLESLANAVCQHWKRKDRGIWEVRGKPQHFVHSKVMSWVALDRALKLAEALGHPENPRWRRCYHEIREEILTRGWNEQKRSFVQHYETDALDASNLLIPMVGFLPRNDERVQSTARRTMEELGVNGLIRRYKTEETDDGLRGPEQVFTMCTFWLVDNLVFCGEVDLAKGLFEKLLGYANHLGLFSEMVDPFTRESLGNFPQAFTHVSLIHTARNLDLALSQKAPEPEVGYVSQSHDR